MKQPSKPPTTAAELIDRIESWELFGTQRRDQISAVNRICAMVGASPGSLHLDVAELRVKLGQILPAAHGISRKTFANLRSLFLATLEDAGIIQRAPRGAAQRHLDWSPLVSEIANDKRLSCGLAGFSNWCAVAGVHPANVTDQSVLDFLEWLESQTLVPKPRDIVRRVPNCWNDARKQVSYWPEVTLCPLSFREPSQHRAWEELDPSLCADAEAYFAMRASPDLFDERPNAPSRPLAQTTIRQQREHIRLSCSVLIKSGTPVGDLTSLADLVEPNAFKIVLRHYHSQAGGEPNAFVECLAKTLIAVAKYHVNAEPARITELKKLASKLPSMPFDLAAKNKALLHKFKSERLRAQLLYLPEQLLKEAADNLDASRRSLVAAQVAIAVDILLVAPLRPQNLARLNWRRHFSEPDGPRGKLVLHIPAAETKTGKRELIFDLPAEVARRLRWYRRDALSRLSPDPSGDLFVTLKGKSKTQQTLTVQIEKTLEDRLGVRLTPHQFRHLSAAFYLEERPEDFETVRALLGHAFSKTTLIYAGASSRRASRAYGDIVYQLKEALRLKRPRKRGMPARVAQATPKAKRDRESSQ